jgi:hypothetical protein
VSSGLSSGQVTSRRRRNQQRAARHHREQAASRQQQLLTTCVKLKDLCINGKLQTTKHTTIMEQLQIRAEQFRKQRRLQEHDLEQIIKEMKAEGQSRGSEGGNNKTAADIEHKRVMEAVEEGLLQSMASPQTPRNLEYFE